MTDDDNAYTGYKLDDNKHVVEFYDHTNKNPDYTSSINTTSSTPFIQKNPIPKPLPRKNNVTLNSSVPLINPNIQSHTQIQPLNQPLIPLNTTIQVPVQPQNTTLIPPTSLSQQPILVLDEHKKSYKQGCCYCCEGCLCTCSAVPCCSILSFFILIIGAAATCLCGWYDLEISSNLWADYGPKNGNPIFDPTPIWIKNIHLNVGYDWQQVNKQYKPGNYFPWIKTGLKYTLVILGPFLFLIGLSMLTSSYFSGRQIIKRSTYTSWKGQSETNICCSLFLLILVYFLILCYLVWTFFSVLPVYYYRMVDERCWNLNDLGFSPGIQKNICLDLVQLGVVRFVPTSDKGYGKLCGPGNNIQNEKIYGDLSGYCEKYMTPYLLSIGVFAGNCLTIVGLVNFAMILTSDYSMLSKKMVKKFIKMDATEMDNRSYMVPNLNQTVSTVMPTGDSFTSFNKRVKETKFNVNNDYDNKKLIDHKRELDVYYKR